MLKKILIISLFLIPSFYSGAMRTLADDSELNNGVAQLEAAVANYMQHVARLQEELVNEIAKPLKKPCEQKNKEQIESLLNQYARGALQLERMLSRQNLPQKLKQESVTVFESLYKPTICFHDPSIESLYLPWRMKQTRTERKDAIYALLMMLAKDYYEPLAKAYENVSTEQDWAVYANLHENAITRNALEAQTGLRIQTAYVERSLFSYVSGLTRKIPITIQNIETIVDMLSI